MVIQIIGFSYCYLFLGKKLAAMRVKISIFNSYWKLLATALDLNS